MKVKQAFYKDETSYPWTEWTIITSVGKVYSGLPMNDHSVYDHFEVKRLSELPKSMKRVKLEDCPWYVPIWAKRELA